jgi:hypothetical protein
MRYVAIGLLFGGVWAVIQWARGEITEPVALAIPILFCGIFGGLLWVMRKLVIALRKKFH